MKQKLKDFYEKNKGKIKTIGTISIGVITGWLLGSKLYNTGKQDGMDICEKAVGLLMEKAIEKNPDVTIKEFVSKEFITGLADEIIESYN